MRVNYVEGFEQYLLDRSYITCLPKTCCYELCLHHFSPNSLYSIQTRRQCVKL